MKKSYSKPTTNVMLIELQTILAGSVTGSSVNSTEVTNVSGFSRGGRDDWDDED